MVTGKAKQYVLGFRSFSQFVYTCHSIKYQYETGKQSLLNFELRSIFETTHFKTQSTNFVWSSFSKMSFYWEYAKKKTLNQIQLITPENTITYHNALCLSLKSLQAGKHCLQFLLGVKMAPGETENDAYEKFWGDKQRTLWHVTVFLEWAIASTFQIRTRT